MTAKHVLNATIIAVLGLGMNAGNAGEIILHEAIDDYSGDQGVGFDTKAGRSFGGYESLTLLDEAYFDYDGDAAREHNMSLNRDLGLSSVEIAAFELSSVPVRTGIPVDLTPQD